MPAKWSSKFELKPGKWVFIPTSESVYLGKKIKKALEICWIPPWYYFHLRAGGHVEALRLHLKNTYFLRIDIQDFFGSINRTRATRCLKCKFPYKLAREYANASTVMNPHTKKTILPFGFVQSQIIAALCLEKSALGILLNSLSTNPNLSVTLYVDDIVISSMDVDLLKMTFQDLQLAADRSNFVFNSEKQEGPAPNITAFNVMLTSGDMRIESERLRLFRQAIASTTNENRIDGIKGYVASVNFPQSLTI